MGKPAGGVISQSLQTDDKLCMLQAVECKEGLPIEADNTTVASINYQSLFGMYAKLAGMTVRSQTWKPCKLVTSVWFVHVWHGYGVSKAPAACSHTLAFVQAVCPRQPVQRLRMPIMQQHILVTST